MPTVNRTSPNRRTFTQDGRIGHLLVRGAKLKANVVKAVTSGSIDLSTAEVSQLNLTIADPDLELLRSDLFSPGGERYRGSTITYADLLFEVAAVEVADAAGVPTLTISARARGAQQVRREKGELVRKGLSPTGWAEREAGAAGMRFVGQKSGKRSVISRQKDETSWDCLQRLASELGYICFEAANTLYFGKPVWLTDEAAKHLRVEWARRKTDDRILKLPTCRRTGDDAKKVASVSLEVTGALGDDARPGQRLVLDGVPTFEGRYLVDRVVIPLSDVEPVRIEGITPVNPKPEPPLKGGSGGGADATGATGRGTASAFVSEALRMAGGTYVYGAEATAANPHPAAFDCSELIQWAAARVGVTFSDGSSQQIADCRPISVEQAINTRGALLWHEGHIAISLGNGRTIEAANPSAGVTSSSARNRFARGGLIPGMAY